MIVILFIVAWLAILIAVSAHLPDISGTSPFVGIAGFFAAILTPIWLLDRVGKAALPSEKRREMEERQRNSSLYSFSSAMIVVAFLIGVLATLGVLGS